MIIVKVGGSIGINYDHVLRDFASRTPAILVHGGSGELNTISEKLGKPPVTLTSVSGFTSRYTDRETLEIFEMVYCGKMNKMIVEKLQQLGVNAIGLCGMDGGLLRGKRKPALRIVDQGKHRVIRDDYTGKVETVNTGLLRLLIENGYSPVISPPALSRDNEAINVDGDRAAAVIAASMKADALIILSNVPGLLKNINDEGSLIKHISKDRVSEYMKYAEGRMKKKVMGAIETLENGVDRVIFGDARVENPIEYALNGHGTVIS
ncbi:MAG: [LysW]-aminoadipate kinase [archaeon]